MIGINSTKIEGVKIIDLFNYQDDRGKFNKVFSMAMAQSLDIDFNVVQINTSLNFSSGQIRGMHYQDNPSAEEKLIMCTSGKVFDVAVDLRADSPTFLHWHGEILSSTDSKMIHIPKGCAHGFQALEDNTHLLYLHSNEYDSNAESGIMYNDPFLNIQWPLKAKNISQRDVGFKKLSPSFIGIKI